jgi:DnaJ-class molecular chaperone
VADLHPVALNTVIKLSRQEAVEGTTVSLEVPVRVECQPCGGRGESPTGPCPTCAGSGVELRPRPVRVAVPPGVRDGSWYRLTLAPGPVPPTRIQLRVLVA